MRALRLAVSAIGVFLVLHGFSQAAVRLPKIFSSHMVIQQQQPIRVFGWADAEETVTVEFNEKTATTKAGSDGRWRVNLPAMTADNRSLTLTVSGEAATGSGNAIKLTDVVLGEVWICSGQSNMEWSLNQTLNGKQEIASADYPLIRLFNVPQHITNALPQADVNGTWQRCSPSSVGGFSAVGYFFGRKLFEDTGVPVGLVGSNWGGTRIEPWTPPVGFYSVPELDRYSSELKKLDPTSTQGAANYTDYLNRLQSWIERSRSLLADGKPIGTPPNPPNPSHIDGATLIYNGMIHGLAPFSCRGAIWYQGESNGGEGESYYHKKRALINGWRSVFENDELAFYFVQLANFQNPNDNPAGGDGWARIREAQRKTLTVPKTGMAVTIDIGEAGDIHPRNKQDVGARLARWALHDVHGQDVVPCGPLYRELSRDGSKIRLTFDHVGKGLMVGAKQGLEPAQEVATGELKRFAVAGSNKVWHWATATIDGDQVVVSSDKVAEPVAVRYAYSMNPAGANLYNREGLPAAPFRTDNW